MKRSKLLIIFLFLMSCYAYAQTVSRESISSQGSFDANETMTLEWTLGDTFAETVISQNRMFTQGFNQSFLLITEDLTSSNLRIAVYPNPANNLLNIKMYPDYGSEVSFFLYDITGKLIYQSIRTLAKDSKLSVDVNNLENGIYILKLINADQSKIETHRIIKN